jgi:hypothetical protein
MNKLILTPLLIFSFGCATIIQSGPDQFPINSTPQGAMVYIDGIPVGQTPMMGSCARKSECVVRLEKEGYETAIVDRDKVLAGWVFGNIILGGGLGIVVDLIFSNQGKYQDAPMFSQLAPTGKAAARDQR